MNTPGPVQILPLAGLPEITTGDDVAGALLNALAAAGTQLRDGDVLVVSSKVISKAAGLRAPAEEKAVQVLRQSSRVVAERATPTGVTRIVRSLAGPVMAAAGIDASNTGDDGSSVLLLPSDPDAAATQLRAHLADRLHPTPRFGLVISDTAGRAWRVGQTDFALGSSGLQSLEDLRGTPDADGRELSVTARAVADEIAAAADLVKHKSARVAAALVRGVDITVGDAAEPPASALIRPADGDWFALGHVEAVRAALGVPPGTPQAHEVGLPGTGTDTHDTMARLRRACALALYTPQDDEHERAAAAHPKGGSFAAAAMAGVQADIVQIGVRLRAPDDYRLGQAVARLCVALAAEGLCGRPADRDAAAPTGRPHEALVILA